MIISSALIVLFICIVSVVCLWVYRKTYEAVAVKSTLTNEFVRENKKEYNNATRIFILVIVLLVFPISCFSLATLFHFSFYFVLKHLFVDVIYCTYPVFVYWLCIPCLFLSLLIVADSFILLSYIRFGKNEYVNYLCYAYVIHFELKRKELTSNIHAYRFDEYNIKDRVKKELKENYIVFLSVSVMVCLITVALVNITCVYGHDKIQIGILREYSVSDIENIYLVEKYKAPAGNIVDEPYYVVEFKDNYSWNDRNKHAGFEKAADYLQNQCGIKIIYTDIYN